VEVGFGLVMVSVVVHAWLAWASKAEVRHASHTVATTILRIEDALEQFEPGAPMNDAIESVTTELVATMEDFFSGLHVPTAGDQLVGGGMQLLQMWFQRKMMGDMDPSALAAMLGGPPEEATEANPADS